MFNFPGKRAKKASRKDPENSGVSPLFSRWPPGSAKPAPKEVGPFTLFRERHLDDPDYPKLLRPNDGGNDPLKRKFIDGISRRSWRNAPSRVRLSNAIATSTYPAKQEGRKPRTGQFSCSDPLEVSDSKLRFTGSEKCAMLADHFDRRFSAPTLLGRRLSFTAGPNVNAKSNLVRRGRSDRRDQADHCPQTLFNNPVQGRSEASAEVEDARATGSMAPQKAPGPDRILPELLLRPPTQLFNLIMNTGKFPQPLVQIYLVLLDKPRKPPEHGSSKRPISLFSLMAEDLGAAVLHSLMMQLEGSLEACRNTYRRGGGTGHHHPEMGDFVKATRSRNEHLCINSIDVDGGFDTPPREN